MSLRRSKGGSRHNSLNSSSSTSSKAKAKNLEDDADFSDVPDTVDPINSVNQSEISARRRSSMVDFDTLRHDIFDEMNSLHGYLQLLKLQYPDNEEVQLAMSQCNNVITMVKNLRGIKFV